MKQTIKLVRIIHSDQHAHQIEVFPKISAASHCIPLFLINTDKGEKWVHIPGVTAEEVYNTWRDQIEKLGIENVQPV
jgi:hypothetical protein